MSCTGLIFMHDVIDSIATFVAVFLVGLAVLAVLLWYFTIYDTAKGKCQRGDVNACIVWQAQQ